MSLFTSAFDSPSAGPSTLSAPSLGKLHKDGNKKRKRASLGGVGGGGDRLKSTEANLHKIMKRVEGGEVKEKDGGGANMGRGSMGSHHDKGKGLSKAKAKVGGQGGKVEMKGKGAKERALAKEQAQSNGEKPTSPRDASKKARKLDRPQDQRPDVDGKPAPAELPLPHDAPKSKRKAAGGDDSLTDLQRGMQAKLEGARFRWINEQLYSNPSTEAVAMMKKDPKIFEDYHETHRALTSAWPSPPLPHLITLLSPLPAKSVIVDLGCGDAGLAKALVPQGKIVLSYDLVGDSGSPSESKNAGSSKGGGWVVEADFLENIPLPGRPGGLGASIAVVDGRDGDVEELSRRAKKGKAKAKAKEASEVVDVVVCCLSLMGVNWIGGVYEACRILKQGGSFHIAEVTSRFISFPSFITAIESFGFKLKLQSAPSTHFTLFEFIKESEVPLGPARGEEGWEGRVKEGEGILRGCVYKKR